MLRWSPLGFPDFVADIEAGRPYSYARYCDGEWRWILGDDYANCDRHETYPAGSEELRAALVSRPPYRVGNMGVLRRWDKADAAHRAKWQPVMDWIAAHGLADYEWHAAGVWFLSLIAAHDAGEPWPVLDALRRRRVVLVGPRWLQDLRDTLGLARHVEVPAVNCYEEIDRIERDIVTDWRRGLGPTVYALCCSFSAKILVHRLHGTVGRDNWLLDFGSVFAPYVGQAVRGYQREWRDRGELPLTR